MTHADALRRIRFWIVLFIIGLVLSGVTAFPLKTELDWLAAGLHHSWMQPAATSAHLLPWIERVQQALTVTSVSYPFLAYGTDWLAFAHLVIAIAFVGPYVDPVRNKWVVTFGLIACVAVIPLALIAGQVRDIPFGWRMIDCSFGVVGAIPLLRCKQLIEVIERPQ
ncbi:hypothetical protein AB4Y89_17070 [Terriglobus sp. 2YAB30_2]|uniref:hypothetical protein n=1 Tax=unclassified Terriglobus TaxID=2628988 RepID=UPI003F982D37